MARPSVRRCSRLPGSVEGAGIPRAHTGARGVAVGLGGKPFLNPKGSRKMCPVSPTRTSTVQTPRVRAEEDGPGLRTRRRGS